MEQVNTNASTSETKSEKDNRKQSLYFPGDMLAEMKEEARRLDRSLSWVVQRAWKLSKGDIAEIPSITDTEESF